MIDDVEEYILCQEGLGYRRDVTSSSLGVNILGIVPVPSSSCTRIKNATSGRAEAQAVSCRLPISAGWVRTWFRSCGICGGQSGTGAGIFQILQFPLPSISQITPHSSSSIIIRGCYSRPNRDVINSVPLHPLSPKRISL
jgi:hypothetical protein